MSYASEVSRLNDDVQGGSGRKFRGGRILTQFLEAFPPNCGLPNDIAYDPVSGTMMIVGAAMLNPVTEITLLVRNPVTRIWSFVVAGIPTNNGGAFSVACNNGRYIVAGTPFPNPSNPFWWTDDRIIFTNATGFNTPPVQIPYILPTNENVNNTLVSGRDLSTTYKSFDNGKTWSVLGGNGNGSPRCFLNEFGNIHCVRDNPVNVAKSTDGGITWVTWPGVGGFAGWSTPNAIAWNGLLGGAMVVIGAAGAGVPGGPKALVAVTHDAGSSVQLVANPRNVSLVSICVLPDGNFLSAGSERGDGRPYAILGSIDGLTWKDIDLPNTLSDIRRIRYLNGRVWFVGNLFGNPNGVYSMSPSAFFF